MSDKVLRLLRRMRGKKTGFTRVDLEKLLRGFGFEMNSGSKHDIFSHPDHPDLIQTVTRASGEMPPGYIREAVRQIDQLLERSSEEGESDE